MLTDLPICLMANKKINFDVVLKNAFLSLVHSALAKEVMRREFIKMMFTKLNFKKIQLHLVLMIMLTVMQHGIAPFPKVVLAADETANQPTTITPNVDVATDSDKDGIPDGIECLGYISDVTIAVVNGSFELPDVTTNFSLTTRHWGNAAPYAVDFHSFLVQGWNTTATDHEIELWQSGFNGVPAYKGKQFAEINANQSAALYQDVMTTPGSKMRWSFAHRGRTGVDTLELLVGPPNGPYQSLGIFKTGTNAWSVYSGDYVVPAQQTTTRFLYKAVATANGDTTTGNFLDDIQFFQQGQCTLDTDGDGIPNSLDLDSDNDGIPDVVEAGLPDKNGDGMVDDPALIGSVGAPPDTDGDKVFNFLDLDSDGDGIPDNVEAQTTTGYVAPPGKVAANGIDTAYGNGLKPVDTDKDSAPDYLDTDTDSDSVVDTTEASLKLAGSDADHDGLDKGVDTDDRTWGPVNLKITNVLKAYPNDGKEVNWRVKATTKTTNFVQTAQSGGLESEPLKGDPSTFIGGTGDATLDATTKAAEETAAAERLHKARLLADIKLKLDDFLPTAGPNGTTATAIASVPDVLAITSAPDAKAVDFVDSDQQVQASVLGILSVGQPYPHDYGVCNRFKGYTIDEIAPVLVNVPPANQGWFWHSHGNQGDAIHEDAFIFHIFVNEAQKQFHVDSRWTQDSYGQKFDFAFDYVFNMQVWSNNLATSQALLQAVLLRLTDYEDGSWQVLYHNQTQPIAPDLIVNKVRYEMDNIRLSLVQITATTPTSNTMQAVTVAQTSAQAQTPVHVYGAWRSYLDRTTLQPFDYQINLADQGPEFLLNFPGLLDITVYVEHDGFTDKVYTGSGLWFAVSPGGSTAKTQITPGQCRSLDSIDKHDLLLAGCVDGATPDLTNQDAAGIGRTLNPNGRSVDISPYKALHFWAKGDGAPVRIQLESAGITDHDYYQTVFTPDSEWRQYIIPLSQFSQRGFGAPKPFLGTDIKAVIWLNATITGKPMNLALDQVSFTSSGLLTLVQQPTDSADTNARPIQVQAPDGVSVAAMLLHYSVDGGTSFITVPLTLQSTTANGVLFQGVLPGQALGTDVVYYIEARQTNGYISKSPLDAPASLYRYRVDDRSGLLVDDFAGSELQNRLGGGAGFFNSPTAGGRLSAYRQARQLILDYDVSQADQIAGYFTDLGKLDARPYTTIDILLRGENGGENLLVGLSDSKGKEPRLSVGDLLPGGITKNWQWVQIPLVSFPAELDRSALANFSFAFLNSYAPMAGRVYIKEVRFTKLATPLVIDSFDDANLQMNAQGLGYWTTAPNSTLQAATETGDAVSNSGAALRLNYTINSGGYAIWHSTLANPSVAATDKLQLWAKGANQAVPPTLYLTDGTVRAQVALADYLKLSNSWQLAEIPLAAFVKQGLDLSHLTGFEVVFEHNKGSGVFWVDNIRIGHVGAPQVEQRVLYLTDMDQASIALHLADGSRWQAQSDANWLLPSATGFGPATLSIASFAWNLTPGTYDGHVTVTSATGATETIAVHLTVTQLVTPHLFFMPLVVR